MKSQEDKALESKRCLAEVTEVLNGYTVEAQVCAIGALYGSAIKTFSNHGCADHLMLILAASDLGATFAEQPVSVKKCGPSA